MALVEQLGDDSWWVVCAACSHMALVFALVFAIVYLYKTGYFFCPFVYYIYRYSFQ